MNRDHRLSRVEEALRASRRATAQERKDREIYTVVTYLLASPTLASEARAWLEQELPCVAPVATDSPHGVTPWLPCPGRLSLAEIEEELNRIFRVGDEQEMEP